MRWRAISVKTNAIEELASLFSRIYQLFRLETINLRFNPVDGNESDSDSDGRLSLQSSILSAPVASFNVRAPSKLTSLSLHNLRASGPHPLESFSMQTILTTLQRLRLSAVFASYPDPSTVFNRLARLLGYTLAPNNTGSVAAHPHGAHPAQRRTCWHRLRVVPQ